MKTKIISETNNIKKETYSSKYLYSVPGSHFKHMTYEEAIKEKIKLGKQLKENLVNTIHDTDFLADSSYEEYSIINERLKAVSKAIEYNELLLKDLKDK